MTETQELDIEDIFSVIKIETLAYIFVYFFLLRKMEYQIIGNRSYCHSGDRDQSKFKIFQVLKFNHVQQLRIAHVNQS